MKLHLFYIHFYSSLLTKILKKDINDKDTEIAPAITNTFTKIYSNSINHSKNITLNYKYNLINLANTTTIRYSVSIKIRMKVRKF